jgi:DNA-directed RNA polymerase specialized sigma24 family protein
VNTSTLTEMVVAHGAWLRRIARGLLDSDAAADDLASDTWKAAIEKPPAAGWDIRAWLFRVAKNRASNLRRGASRRLGWESAAGLEGDRTVETPCLGK